MKKVVIGIVVGLVAGYWLGYYDAFRGEKSIGSRIRIAVGAMSPEGIAAERQRRAEQLRDTIHARAGTATNLP